MSMKVGNCLQILYLTKVTAYLPLKILLNFTLADRFDINGQRYKINSIKTNLQDGKSEIELLNEL